VASVTWQCPQCGRRVPNRAAECHCGTTREAALAAAAHLPPTPAAPAAGRRPRPASPYRFSWASLPGEIKLMVVGLGLVLLAGIAFLVFVPSRPQPIVPLLGWSEPTSSRPKPSPTAAPRAGRRARNPSPSPSPEPKKGWLPW
jgi:hypothetical protein